MGSDTSTRSPEGYFADALGAFEKAAEAGCVGRHYEIGGYAVHLRIAGPEMLRAMTPALEHLAIDRPPSSDLTVCIWDSVSTGSPPLAPPRTTDSRRLGRRGEIAALNDDRFRTVYRVDARVFSMLDASRDLAVLWVPDASKLPTYIRGAPLNFILNWWMSRRGLKLVHAGAVGFDHGGVLLAGAGGCGKSSTALRCLDSELLYAADDYCLARIADEPRVFSLYSSAKLNAADIGHFAALEAAIANPEELGDEKALLMLHRILPRKLCTGFPLRAILLPRISGVPETTIDPVSPAEALMAWMPSNTEQLPGEFDSAFELMSALVRSVPTARLELGTDRDRIAEVIVRYLEEYRD